MAGKSNVHAADKTYGEQPIKKSPPATPAFKKRHRGCSFCILDLENIPEFPSDEVVSVITMEDVIEELLQEEILDETDKYVNIHNRIKVHVPALQERAPDADSKQLLQFLDPLPVHHNNTNLQGTSYSFQREVAYSVVYKFLIALLYDY